MAGMLRGSGFVFVPSADFASDARFAKLAPYKLQAVAVKSGTIFVYPAPGNGGAFIGGAREMQALERGVLNKRARRAGDAAQTNLARRRGLPAY